MKNDVFVEVARLAVLLSAFYGPSSSATVLCLKYYAEFEDSGRVLQDGVTTEDKWIANDFQEVRGANHTIRADSATGSLLTSGFFGDGTTSQSAGCSASFTIPPGTNALWVQFKSLGYVRDNQIRVRDDEAAGRPFDIFDVTLTAISSPVISVGLIQNDPTRHAMWNAYAVSAYALYRSAGGLTGKTFTVDVYSTKCRYKARDESCQTSFYDGSSVKLQRDFGSDRKFIIVHELGHHLYDLAGIALNADCSLPSSVCPASGGGHSMASKEYQSCAYNEGAAHFYAARVWNLNTQADCVFGYYKSELGMGANSIAFDCEGTASSPLLSGANAFPTRYLEVVCGGTLSDRGVEADWLRLLWDVYTNGATPPSFPEMVSWMQGAFASSGPGDTPFSNLDDEAGIVGGSIEANWLNSAPFNGVDHP